MADSNPLFRAGLRVLIERDSRMAVIVETGSGPDLFTALYRHSPDAVVVSSRISGLDVFEIAQTIRSASVGTKVITITERPHRNWFRKARKVTAHKCLSKVGSFARLHEALCTALPMPQ